MSDKSIEELTYGIKQLREQFDTRDTFQMSAEVHADYIAAIRGFRDKISELRTKAEGLVKFGDPGLLKSSQRMRSQMIENVHGPGGFLERLDKYVAYLVEFQETVNAAFNRFRAHDQATPK
jgi:hypothetical protein